MTPRAIRHAGPAGVGILARGEPPTDPLGQFLLWWNEPALGWSGPTAGTLVIAVVIAIAIVIPAAGTRHRSGERRGTRRRSGERRGTRHGGRSQR